MNKVTCRLVFLILSIFISSCSTAYSVYGHKKDVTPFDFGLASAKDDMERYEVLLKTHKAALATGVNVDYSGIDTIKLMIPANPSSIPLTKYNDFKGCVFVVRNMSKVCWLFEKKNEGKPIAIDKKLIDKGDFRSVDALKQGRYLLIVEDGSLWVLQRCGKKYGHTRKDVLLVENGEAKNTVVISYNNAYSKPKCTYVKLGKEPLIIKNISVVRDPSCTYLTHIANITGADGVRFENVSIKTPESPLTDDRGISIYNCTNVTMDNVRIEGTYSHTDHSGYGISLNNVWNYNANRLYGKANWGIFGNNNVNVARIEDSQINRFDIHCYGRDVSFKNVSFFDLYNQYSSVYGTIQYDKCTFTNFVPVLNGGSYNAYVEHDIIFNDCVFNSTPQKRFLIRVGRLNDVSNERYELAQKCLPNVIIRNMTVNLQDDEEDFYIFYGKIADMPETSMGYLSQISIDGLTINPSRGKPVKQMMLSNIEIGTKNTVDCRVKNVVVNNPQTKSLFGVSRPSIQLKTNIPVKGGKVQLQNARCVIQ